MSVPRSASWWRVQRWYLLGALVFGAWALYAPYRAAWRNWARSHPMVPLEVRKDAQAGYLGARWRLLNLTERDVTGLEPDQMVLVARFEMVLDAGTDPKALSLCEARLTDARGRAWTSNSAPAGASRRTLPTACASGFDKDLKAVLPEPGKPWLFEKSFLVPRGLEVRALGVEIFVTPMVEPERPGLYLRFTP